LTFIEQELEVTHITPPDSVYDKDLENKQLEILIFLL